MKILNTQTILLVFMSFLVACSSSKKSTDGSSDAAVVKETEPSAILAASEKSASEAQYSKLEQAIKNQNAKNIRDESQRILRTSPGDEVALSAIASSYLLEGNYRMALGHLNLVVQKSQRAEIYYNRGLALDGLGQKSEAVASYRDALKKDAGFSLAKIRLAQIFYQAGDYRKAVASLSDVVNEQSPVDYLYLYAESLRGKGDKEAARRHYEWAVQSAKSDVKIKIGYARVLIEDFKEMGKARDLLDQLAVTGVPSNYRKEFQRLSVLSKTGSET